MHYEWLKIEKLPHSHTASNYYDSDNIFIPIY